MDSLPRALRINFITQTNLVINLVIPANPVIPAKQALACASWNPELKAW